MTFDRNTNLLHFNDGTSWFMGCVSGGTESDGGTMYPTVVEDSNGNEVLIAYRNGFGTSWPNSSGRIATITDVRSVNNGGFLPASYTFSYANNGSGDPIEHIDTIRNTVGTAENFNFNTSTGAQFIPPFSGASALPVTTNLVFLTGGVCGSPCAVGSTAPNYTYHFFYNSAEEMTQVVFPAGGDMRWDYVSYTYSDVRTIREVSNRYLATGASGSGYGAEVLYPITHGSDASNQNAIPFHTTTVLDDPSGSGEKVWTFIPFSTANPAQAGLVSVFDQRSGPSGVSLKQDTYTWTADPGGNQYIFDDVTVMNSGQSYAQTSKAHQELDGNGNVTIKKVYDYGNLTTPIRIYNYAYLNSTPYVNAYIRNRLTSATVTDGSGLNMVTLTSNSYDGTTCANATPRPDTSQATLHDAAYNTLSGVYRGNLTLQTTPQGYTCTLYDYLGNTYFTKAPHAPAVGVATAGGTNGSNYSLPSQVTPNSNSNLSASLTYTGSFAPSGFTGPNGQVANATYDGYGRVLYSTSVDGAVTFYTYSAAGVLPMTQMALPSIYDPFGNVYVPHRWTLTTLDGLGRPVSVQSGPPGTTTAQTETDTMYGPCACSPTGKMTQTSQPHTPGPTAYWTKYTYDGLGRTLTVQAPDGASTTTSVYQGNTVQVTDPAGKWKKTASDMQGNTVQVTEPDPAGGSGLITNYTYDVMEHLTGVSMPRGSVTQTRTFHYDSGTHLLTSEIHPETGTTSYAYFTTGNPDPSTYDLLYSKTDAKGQVTKYDYDAYDRVTTVHRMPNGTTEDVCQRTTYTYDATPGTVSGFSGTNTWGHVAAVVMGDPSNPTACQVTVHGYTVPQQFSEFYSYSVAGHVTTKRLELDQPNGAGGAGSMLGQWWDVGYTFNALGQMVTTSYPGTGGNYPATGGPDVHGGL